MALAQSPEIRLTSQQLFLIQQLHELTGKDKDEIISTALHSWMETLKGIYRTADVDSQPAIHWGIDSW